MPGWLRTSLVIAAVTAGALLLWVGFALLVVALLIVALPLWVWSLFARRRALGGSVTIEGSARRVDETVVLEEPPVEEKKRVGPGPRKP